MKLRRATIDDAMDVLAWRNDPASIAASKTPQPVAREGHLRWFERAVGDSTRVLLIAEDQGQKIGMVRFDRSDDFWRVSINLAPAARRKGYGRKLLPDAIRMLRADVGACRIVAEVRNENASSLRLFEALGFVRQGDVAGLQTLALD